MPSRDVVLDTNVIGTIAAAPEPEQAKLLVPLQVAKLNGARLLLTPTILHEIAHTYSNPDLLKKLVAVARSLCAGILPLQAWEIFKAEVDHDDPYSFITTQALLPIESLDDLEDATKVEEVRKFYEAGAFGNKGMRRLLSKLDPYIKLMKAEPLSFAQFVDGCRLARLTDWLAAAKDRGVVEQMPDVEALWKRAVGIRLLILVQLANEYRRLTRTQKKGEGCLTDLRIVSEAAYSHEIRTQDGEFIECVRLVETVSNTPKIAHAWPPHPEGLALL